MLLKLISLVFATEVKDPKDRIIKPCIYQMHLWALIKSIFVEKLRRCQTVYIQQALCQSIIYNSLFVLQLNFKRINQQVNKVFKKNSDKKIREII